MKTLMMFVLVCAIALPVQAQQAGWLGLSIEDGKDQGASIRSVEADSPASKAGLKSGDLIVEYNKTTVLGSVQLTRLIRETPPGRTVEVKVRHDNKDQTMQVTIGSVRDQVTVFRNRPAIDLRDAIRNSMPRIEIMVNARAGVQVQNMTAQLREYFGVTGNDGVLVTYVEKDSAVDKAGLKAGDVVTAIDNHNLRNPYDFSAEMRANARLTLHVVRDKKEMNIVVDRTTNTR